MRRVFFVYVLNDFWVIAFFIANRFVGNIGGSFLLLGIFGFDLGFLDTSIVLNGNLVVFVVDGDGLCCRAYDLLSPFHRVLQLRLRNFVVLSLSCLCFRQPSFEENVFSSFEDGRVVDQAIYVSFLLCACSSGVFIGFIKHH